MSKARQRGNIEYNGNRVSFYPDFSVEVQKQRAKFVDVKRRLRSQQITYSMMYPAKLLIMDGDPVRFF